MQSRGNLIRGIALVPIVLIGVAGAIRAAQPLLATRRAPVETRKVTASYSDIARHLRAKHDLAALEIWGDLQTSDTPLLISSNSQEEEVGDFSLQMALLDACLAMVERGGQWADRCLTLAKRLEDTPDQTEVGLELAWRIKRLVKGGQPRTAAMMAAESIP